MLGIAFWAATGWITVPLHTPSLARYEGRQLGAVRLVEHAQSAIIDGVQVVELTLQGERRWLARCERRQAARRGRLACRLEAPGEAPLRLSLRGDLDREWSGDARIPAPVTIQATEAPDDLAPTLVEGRVVDQMGIPLADWRQALRLQLRIRDDLDPATRERLCALVLTLDVAGRGWDLVPPVVYDGYRLRPAASGRGADAHHVDHPAFLADLPRLDRAAGVLVEREGSAGRLVMELAFNSASAPTAVAAGPDGLQSFGVEVGAGLRLGQRSHVSVGMGLQAGTTERDTTHLATGAFAIGLHARQAFELGAIEAVIGARTRGRLRMAEGTLADGETRGSASQFGLGLAPTLALQWPWLLNRYDTRLVAFIEAAPECSWWGAPSLESMSAELARAVNAELRARDWQVTTAIGLRFEL